MKTDKNQSEAQPSNPLHGVRLIDIVEYLQKKYGWEELGRRINIRCFTHNPSLKSSLTFLRKTPWARTKVEELYLRSIKSDEKNTERQW
ncbi:VF530 family DNA-binding protein [Cyclobacterium jeungdonense]|uniref:VF530 family protein n=1 Tax=Cyclobacterium jeungdonense TaxID=708087 RepID=A0ABT8C860_9BACT|nr:VF530 family protein [Cyclobacterium jeungdonense]MDN3688954.1 VF530 family protein [Cyclobacterium jeungdonense]